MEPTLRQICIADDETWGAVTRIFSHYGLKLARIPNDEDGTENYCLSPKVF